MDVGCSHVEAFVVLKDRKPSCEEPERESGSTRHTSLLFSSV